MLKRFQTTLHLQNLLRKHLIFLKRQIFFLLILSIRKKITISINSFKDKCFIFSNSKESLFNSLKSRQKLNDEFKLKIKIEKSVIAAINKSQKNENVVLIITEYFFIDFFIKNQAIWHKFFIFSFIYKDKEWHKVIVHEILSEIFNFDVDIQLLKEEIETFNEIQFIAINWILSKKT